MEKIRRHYIFSGTVQGVGFRYNAVYLARSLDLTGWVKNEWDGTVVMEAQGEERALDELIRLLSNRRYIEIDRCMQTQIPLEPEYQFTVKY